MRKNWRLVVEVAAAWAVAFSSGTSHARCESGLRSFATAVHPRLREKCTPCHDTGGIAPPHSVADVAQSYDRVLAYQDFQDMARSDFVVKGGDFHCRSYGGGADCGMSTDEVLKLAQDWWDGGESACPFEGANVLPKQPLPANLPPRGATFAPMRWSLASLGEAFKDAMVEIDIQQYEQATPEHPGAYLFARPRLATSSAAVHLKNIKIVVNDRLAATATAFSGVDARINAKPYQPNDEMWPFPALSIQSAVVPQTGEGDQIALAFDEIETTSPDYCRYPEQFAADVAPLVEVRCAACHGSVSQGLPGRAPANHRLNLAVPAPEVCAAFLQYTNAGPPLQSPLIAFPLRPVVGHPRVLTGSDDVEPKWTEWIKHEWQP